MKVDTYLDLKQAIIDQGYADEIDWADDLKPCDSPLAFWVEYSWVVLNSGMKNQVARKIWDRILESLKENLGSSVPFASRVFGHKGKAKAIEEMWWARESRFYEYRKSDNKIEFLKSLPWIGDITKYHLAKNLGFDCCKPDRHLVRIAKSFNTTPEALCKRLSIETGDRVATVDLVIWRAANLGII